jgi:hypothetical protein
MYVAQPNSKQCERLMTSGNTNNGQMALLWRSQWKVKVIAFWNEEPVYPILN